MKGPFFVLTCLSVILTSCQSVDATNQITPTSTVKESPVEATVTLVTEPVPTNSLVGDGGLITGIPCEAPCFFGVYPGKTTFDDAKIILSKFGRNNCVQDNTELTFLCGKSILISANLSTRLIDGIGFYPETEVFVGELISKFGNPNSLQVFPGATPEYSRVSVLLLFDNIRIRVHLPELDGSSYLIQNTTEIQLVDYFDTEVYQDMQDNYFSQPWKGYGVYEVNE